MKRLPQLYIHAVNQKQEGLLLQLWIQLGKQSEQQYRQVLTLGDGLLLQRPEIGLSILPLNPIFIELFQKDFQRLFLEWPNAYPTSNKSPQHFLIVFFSQTEQYS